MSKKQAILLSIGLSIFAGYVPFLNQVLTLQRTFCLFAVFHHRVLFSQKWDALFTETKDSTISLLFLPIIYTFIAFFHGITSTWFLVPSLMTITWAIRCSAVPCVRSFSWSGWWGSSALWASCPESTCFLRSGQKHSAGLSFTRDLHQGLAGISDHRLESIGIRLVTLVLASVLLTILLASRPIRFLYARFERGLSFVLLGFLLLMLTL